MSNKHTADHDDSVTEVASVPAERAGGGAGEKTAPPPFGTPKPAGEGDVPRVVSELARVDKTSGLTRFKIACRNYSPQPTKYIVAKDKDSARECYLTATKLADRLAKLKKNGVKDIEMPDLVVTPLPD